MLSLLLNHTSNQHLNYSKFHFIKKYQKNFDLYSHTLHLASNNDFAIEIVLFIVNGLIKHFVKDMQNHQLYIDRFPCPIL